MTKFFAEIEGKNVEDLIAEGRKKLQSVPSGVAVAAAPAGGAGTSSSHTLAHIYNRLL